MNSTSQFKALQTSRPEVGHFDNFLVLLVAIPRFKCIAFSKGVYYGLQQQLNNFSASRHKITRYGDKKAIIQVE